MKKTKATALIMAAVMTFSCMPFETMADDEVVSSSAVSVAEDAEVVSDDVSSDAALEAMEMDGWVKGWSGTTSQEKDILLAPTDTGIRIKTIKAGTGKVSNDEDSVGYYVYEMPSTADFTLKGTIKVNEYNADTSASNPQQSSFGAMIFDNLYQKGGRVQPYTNNFMVGGYMKGSTSANASVAAIHRYNGKRSMDETLVDGIKKNITVEDDVEPFEVEIRKSDELVTVVANGVSYTYNISDLTTNPEKPYFADTIYVGFYGCRNIDMEVSNISLEADTRVVESLELVSAPTKVDYVIDETLDLTGAKLVAHYTDGTSEELSEYTVKGFDTSVMGEGVMTFSKGGLSVEVPYTVSPIMCTKLSITTAPIYSDYYIGQHFSAKAFEVEAEYNNGNRSVLTEDEYEFYVDGKKLDSNFYFTKADLGTKTVVVKHAVTDAVAESDASDSFKINVYDYTLSAIEVGSIPTKTDYAVNDPIEPLGMTVNGVYKNAAGDVQFALLEDDEYEVLPADTSKLGQTTVTVRYLRDPSLTTTFNVNVVEKTAVEFTILHYPRTTYQVDEDFTTEGMKAYIIYNNNDMELTDAYTVDLSKFDNSKAGTTQVVIVPNEPNFTPVTLDVTITNKKTAYWKSTAFGASSSLNNNLTTPTYTEDGKLDTVTVRSWGGAGKVTKDHDGMSYFYTRVPADNNFTISADIYVNDYLEHDNSDEQRNGQEAFGIMARDVIPLNPDMDKLSEKEKDEIQQALDQQAAAGKSEYIPLTVDVNKAELDENGEPVPALMNGKNYKVTFSSNMALVGGYSGTGWPTDPTAPSYAKNSTINRINLVMRTGVFKYDASNSTIEKHGPYKISDTFPARGNKYRVTLTKINGGLYAKCYDYQTGEEKETYQYSEGDDEVDHIFSRQDSENMYVGFFAARWADITVSNIDFHESNPETDPITNNSSDEATTPAIKLVSSEYSTTTDYNLNLRVTNRLGGNLTVQKDGKVIYRDRPVSKTSVLPVELTPNSVNQFTVLYKPNPADNVTSTADIVAKFTVTHKDPLGDYDVIYCAPDGKVTGDGTRENPLDIYSAVGFLEMGKTAIALEGTYTMTKAFSIPFTNTGIETSWKTLRADDGATVTLDMQGKYEGMTLDGDYWHIKGIDFTNSGKNLKPFLLAGNHCIIEDCKFYNNGDTGFQVSRSTDSDINIDMWPAYNVIKNCEAYNNCDPSKINADGFGLKLTVGYGNIFDGCVSHNNVDDGYDAYTKKGEGAIGPVTLVGCVAYDNGNQLLEDGTTKSYDGGGNNGFKMGGESVPVQHYMKDCISFDNNANGITTNTNPALKIRNFVSFRNGGCGFRLYTGDANKRFDYDLKGCVSYKNSATDYKQAYDFVALGETATDEDWPINANHSATPIESPSNYWDGVNSDGEKITDEFFKSVDKNVSVVDNGKYAQDAEGNFILGDFLARATEYVHEADDEVIYPSGPQYGEPATETTTSAIEVTETTTVRRPSPNGGGGGGSSTSTSGNSSKKGSSVAEATTAEADTEHTTSAPVKANSFVTPSGVVITPPVATGVRVNFTDIANRAWAVESINKLAAAGIVNGVSSDKFAPDAYSKRADFIVMLVKTFGLTGPATDNFDDVEAGKYYADALAIAKTAGIATGYGDGNFGPEKTITRQDMMVLVAKALEFAGIELDTDTAVLDSFADADKIADYAKPYVAALANNGFATGTDNGIEPTALITRAQMSVLVAKVYDVVLAAAEEAAEAEEETTVEETTEETTAEAEEETVEDTTVEEETVEETTEAE